jgi:hypothetical protein
MLSRTERREGSKASALLFKSWNNAGQDLSNEAAQVALKLQEILDSESSTYGPSVPVLKLTCSILRGAPDVNKAANKNLRKLELVERMLRAAQAIVADSEGVESSDGAGGFSDSSEGDEPEISEIRGVGESSILFRYRMKQLGGATKFVVLSDMSKELARHYAFMAKIGDMAPAAVIAVQRSLLRCLPVMLKVHTLTAVQKADAWITYESALESFLRKHKSWKKKVASAEGVPQVTPTKNKASKRSRARLPGDSTESDEPSRKVPAVNPFARPCQRVEDITSRDIKKGKSLVRSFATWVQSGDKILPAEAVKYIGKKVASPLSRFTHPVRGIYHVLVAPNQAEMRDSKLRNIFASVVTDLIPGRELRKIEYEAANLLKDKGGRIAKDQRKRRERGETKLLARLSVECELCLMGYKSWVAFDGALKADGVAEAIRLSTQLSNTGSDSGDENTISAKTAMSAWNKAKAAMIRSPPQAASRAFATPAKKLEDQLKAGLALIRKEMRRASGNGNGGWSAGMSPSKGDHGASPKSSDACWHCNKPGHAWYEKAKCPLSGKPPAKGSNHARKAAARLEANGGGARGP